MSCTSRTIKFLLANKLNTLEDENLLAQILSKFKVLIPVGLNLHMQSKMSLALNKQFLPDEKELIEDPVELLDPISDSKFSPVKGIVHRYSDRCLLMPLHTCPVYCRFCFRKEKVGKEKPLTQKQLDKCYEYIEANPKIWEVILSGGDPLLLSPKKLAQIINRLSAIKHVEVLRIHTRIPILCPERITKEMLDSLTSEKPVYIIIHTNHADEFSEKAKDSVKRLVNSGIPLLSQTVLLKGINDSEQALKSLMQELVKNKIKPYYLHHLDLAKGTRHFKVPISKGQKLLKALKSSTSGLCQPTYVLDIPGGYGKIPICQSYISQDKDRYLLTDINEKQHLYKD